MCYWDKCFCIVHSWAGHLNILTSEATRDCCFNQQLYVMKCKTTPSLCVFISLPSPPPPPLILWRLLLLIWLPRPWCYSKTVSKINVNLYPAEWRVLWFELKLDKDTKGSSRKLLKELKIHKMHYGESPLSVHTATSDSNRKTKEETSSFLSLK